MSKGSVPLTHTGTSERASGKLACGHSVAAARSQARVVNQEANLGTPAGGVGGPPGMPARSWRERKGWKDS